MRIAFNKRSGGKNERGAALLTVLFITVVMASLSVSLLEESTRSVLSASGRSTTLQARYFALGAEKLAATVLQASRSASPNKTTLQDPWATENGRFDVGEGYIDGTLTDASNCFNVNSLVSDQEGEGLAIDETMLGQFILIMAAFDIEEQQARMLADTIVDWIDEDSQPRPLGAEDFDYLERPVPHRAANSFMLDTSELLALQGMTADVYTIIRPILCARPDMTPSVYNVNTMTPEQAPLLVSLTEGRLQLSQAIELLGATPPAGYPSIQEFLALPPFVDAGLATDAENQLAVKSRYFRLATTVVFGDALVQLESMFDAGAEQGVFLIARRFGEEV